MRGYHRPKIDLASLASPSRSREQIAADIEAGHPSPVEYSARKLVRWTLDGTARYVDVTPINLRRREEKDRA